MDPDRGTTDYTYDNADQLSTQEDERPVVLACRCDELDRKTGVFKDSVATGTKLADWIYDTIAKGQLTSAIRYTGGNTYTTSVTSYDDGYRPLQTPDSHPHRTTLQHVHLGGSVLPHAEPEGLYKFS